jgi:2-polyprenyl-3-methyl-5-hydroxy-6-metoxy-1,4-benzoquinol methylase
MREMVARDKPWHLPVIAIHTIAKLVHEQFNNVEAHTNSYRLVRDCLQFGFEAKNFFQISKEVVNTALNHEHDKDCELLASSFPPG